MSYKKHIVSLLLFLLVPSSSSFASIHPDSFHACIVKEVVKDIFQAGDYHLRFRVRDHDTWFNVYYHANYNSGRAILRLLHASMNHGIPIFADNAGSSCKDTITNVALTTDDNVTTAGGLL